MDIDVKSAVAYANAYVTKNNRLPNVFLCSYPEYKTREDFLEIRPFFRQIKGVGVEVGTFEGYNATNIIKYCSFDKLSCIDPYLPYPDSIGGLGEFSKDAWDALHTKVLERLGDKAELIRAKSVEVSRKFQDNSLDFVYLDGDHRPEEVRKDIAAWFPKVKIGGHIGGHDFSENEVQGGVTSWVIDNKEYAGDIVFEANDWWFTKR